MIFLRTLRLIILNKLAACEVEVRVSLIKIIVCLHFGDWLCSALDHNIDRSISRYMRHLPIETLFKIPTS